VACSRVNFILPLYNLQVFCNVTPCRLVKCYRCLSRLVVPSSWGLSRPRKVDESKGDGIFIRHIFGDYLPVDMPKRLKSSTVLLWGPKVSNCLHFLNCYNNISYRDTNFDTWRILRPLPHSRFWGVPYLRFWGRRRGWLRGRGVVTRQIHSFVLPSNQRRKTDHETQYPDTCSTRTAFVKDQAKIIQIYEHCKSSRNNTLRAQRFERSHINIQCVHKIPPRIQDNTVLQQIEIDKCNLLWLTVNFSKY